VRNGEQCDDGNYINGDGCNLNCELETVVEEVEETVVEVIEENCEDKELCQIKTRCGDGVVNNDEQCDDGNSIHDDGCTNLCQIEEIILPEIVIPFIPTPQPVKEIL